MESVSKICQGIGCDGNAGVCGIFYNPVAWAEEMVRRN